MNREKNALNVNKQNTWFKTQEKLSIGGVKDYWSCYGGRIENDTKPLAKSNTAYYIYRHTYYFGVRSCPWGFLR